MRAVLGGAGWAHSPELEIQFVQVGSNRPTAGTPFQTEAFGGDAKMGRSHLGGLRKRCGQRNAAGAIEGPDSVWRGEHGSEMTCRSPSLVRHLAIAVYEVMSSRGAEAVVSSPPTQTSGIQFPAAE